jgi:predicted acetyltransferase
MSHKDPEQAREYGRKRQRRYRKKNPEKLKAYYREWCKKNPGYHTKKQREYRQRVSAEITAKMLELVKLLKSQGYLPNVEIIDKQPDN